MSKTPDILGRIVEHKLVELAHTRISAREYENKALQIVQQRRSFRAALQARTPAIIAEIKRASPSKGPLAPNLDPAALALAYQQGGAAALSVLTDNSFFGGSLDDLLNARKATSLPVLRKDFIIDEYQVLEAAAHGADAILLIAAILDVNRLKKLREYAARFFMDSLVEVHNAEELEMALGSGAELIGVNNRDLRSFRVSLDTSLRLVRRIPAGILKVSESGIEAASDLRRLEDAGFDAFLIGEHLVKAADPALALKALLT